jgi:hypothetical protein
VTLEHCLDQLRVIECWLDANRFGDGPHGALPPNQNFHF